MKTSTEKLSKMEEFEMGPVDVIHPRSTTFDAFSSHLNNRKIRYKRKKEGESFNGSTRKCEDEAL